MDIKPKKRVLIGPSVFADKEIKPLDIMREKGYEIVENPYRRKYTKKELMELLPGIEGLIAGLEPLDREVLEHSSLRVISRCGSGMSNVDLQAAQSLGIKVVNTPQAPVNSVAELTVGCMITLLRGVISANNDLREKKWSKFIGRQLGCMTVGVVGFGNIGRRVAHLLAAFGSRVLAVDPRYKSDDGGIPSVTLEEVLRIADILTIHCSGDKCLFGEHEFEMMKPGMFILNAARGTVIDENALKNAIDKKIVAGAWIDTFSKEPYDGVLCGIDGVILTPHIGSYTYECRRDMEMQCVMNLVNAFEDHA